MQANGCDILTSDIQIRRTTTRTTPGIMFDKEFVVLRWQKSCDLNNCMFVYAHVTMRNSLTRSVIHKLLLLVLLVILFFIFIPFGKFLPAQQDPKHTHTHIHIMQHTRKRAKVCESLLWYRKSQKVLPDTLTLQRRKFNEEIWAQVHSHCLLSGAANIVHKARHISLPTYH